MNRKLFSEIRKSCKTKSQRLAFNRLVKSFIDFTDFVPLDMTWYLEKPLNLRLYRLNSIDEAIKEAFSGTNLDNGFDEACKEYKIFKDKQIKPIIDIKDNNVIISIGDLKGVISVYVSYNQVVGSTNPFGREFISNTIMELRLNKQLPEEFISRLKSKHRISHKGKRDPKFIYKFKSGVPEDAVIKGAKIIKWAYAYFINNDILNYF